MLRSLLILWCWWVEGAIAQSSQRSHRDSQRGWVVVLFYLVACNLIVGGLGRFLF